MARQKARWEATYAGHAFREGRSVIIPLRIDVDPERITELRVPMSTLPRFIGAVQRAAGELMPEQAEPEPEAQVIPEPRRRGRPRRAA